MVVVTRCSLMCSMNSAATLSGLGISGRPLKKDWVDSVRDFMVRLDVDFSSWSWSLPPEIWITALGILFWVRRQLISFSKASRCFRVVAICFCKAVAKLS